MNEPTAGTIYAGAYRHDGHGDDDMVLWLDRPVGRELEQLLRHSIVAAELDAKYVKSATLTEAGVTLEVSPTSGGATTEMHLTVEQLRGNP